MYGGDVLESDIYRVIDQRSESDCRGIGNEEYVKLESKEERAIEKLERKKNNPLECFFLHVFWGGVREFFVEKGKMPYRF